MLISLVLINKIAELEPTWLPTSAPVRPPCELSVNTQTRSGKRGGKGEGQKQRGRRPEPRPSQPGEARTRAPQGGRRKNRLGVKPLVVKMSVLDKTGRNHPCSDSRHQLPAACEIPPRPLAPNSPKKNQLKRNENHNIQIPCKLYRNSP